MKKVKLDSGLELQVRETALDDMELLDDLVDLDDGKGYAISRILSRLFDKDQKKKLYEHLRKDGVTPASQVAKVLNEVFEKLGEQGKN